MKRFTPVALALTVIFSAAPAQAGDYFKGRKIYAEHCARCHGNNGVPQVPGTPDFSRGDGLMAPEQALVRSLRYGRGLMPGFEVVLRGRELLDVLAYVRSLQR